MDILDSRLISVAILNQDINIEKLQKIQHILETKFLYYEILLVNPKFTPPPRISQMKGLLKILPT